MKRLLIILLFLPIIGFGQQTYVPDDNFEAYLESNSMGNGIANDDYVTTSNINIITYLNVNSTAIINLKGIEDFTNLIHLECWGNQLATLDISQNTALNSLLCHANQLTALDVSQNTALIDLRCSSNQLTILNVSLNTALNLLWCQDNQLTSIDISNNTSLTRLSCSANQLTSLDVSANTFLIELNCIDNQLTSLDLSANTYLNYLYCYNNLTLYCIDVDNVAWANSTWTSINNNIDSTMSFSVNCVNALGCTDSLACNYNFLATINDATCSFNVVFHQMFRICYGDNVVVGNSIYNTAGIYTDTLGSSNGCDSIVYTNISIEQNTSSYDTLFVAASIVWNGLFLSVSGNYSITLITSAGCDSIVNLNLTITIPSAILNITNTEKTLLKITDILGQETPRKRNTLLFYLYDDGTVEKRIIVE